MYNLKSLAGKVVTIKSHKGDEIVARLMGFNEEGTVLTIHHPKIVVISGDSVVLIPFALTAKCDEVFLHTNQIFAVLETSEVTAEEYLDLVKEELGDEDDADPA